jgi:hypothetical protein
MKPRTESPLGSGVRNDENGPTCRVGPAAGDPLHMDVPLPRSPDPDPWGRVVSLLQGNGTVQQHRKLGLRLGSAPRCEHSPVSRDEAMTSLH